MNKKIFSFDAETNGLWGQAFSIGAVTSDGNKFVARCPIEGEVNHWVAENVLPEMADIPVTHKSYKSMLKDFAKFYMTHKKDADVIVHMGFPVESKVLSDMKEYGFIGEWDAPFPLIDISAFPQIGTSVDSYCEKNNLKAPEFTGGTHNPIYDAYMTMLAYKEVK